MSRRRRTAPPGLRRRSQMSDAEVEDILELLKGFERGEQTQRLSWHVLENLTGRSQRNLRRKDKIFTAFWLAKDQEGKPHPTPMDRESAAIADLKGRIRQRDEELQAKDAEIERWRRKFVHLVINGELRGINVRELWEMPIPEKLPRRGSTRKRVR